MYLGQCQARETEREIAGAGEMIVISSVCELAASKGGGSDQYLQSLPATAGPTTLAGQARSERTLASLELHHSAPPLGYILLENIY